MQNIYILMEVRALSFSGRFLMPDLEIWWRDAPVVSIIDFLSLFNHDVIVNFPAPCCQWRRCPRCGSRSSGPSSFAQFDDANATFVDKSLAIEAFLRNPGGHHLILRLRRCGKSYTLSMIRLSSFLIKYFCIC